MATTLITFRGTVQHYGVKTRAEAEFTFDPPANLAGKLCYVNCEVFSYSPAEISPDLTYLDTFTLTMDWSTPLAFTSTTNGFTKPGTIAACVSPYSGFTSVGPTLVCIPNGPQTIRAIIERSRGANLTNKENEESVMTAVFSMVEANARTAPL